MRTIFAKYVDSLRKPFPTAGILRSAFPGTCMRHSLATHLLKNGTPLKTIGDILGHRSAASTSVYLRLATDDLREVSLPVPGRERPVKEEQQ